MLVIGCQDQAAPIRIEAEPGHLVVLAFADVLGVLHEARTAVADDAAVVPVAMEGMTRVFAWTFDPADLQQIDGKPIPREWLRDVEADIGPDDEPPFCTRCRVPAAIPPKLLAPGDRCPPPRFARAHLFERTKDGFDDVTATSSAAIEQARRQVALQWPGTCSEASGTARKAYEPKLCPILPTEAPRWLDQIAIGPDGTAAGFGDRHAFVIDPSGVVTTSGSDVTPPTIEFAAALPAGAGFIVSVNPRSQTRSEDTTLHASRDLRWRSLGLDSFRAAALTPLGGEDFYLAGHARSGLFDKPMLLRCRVSKLLSGGGCEVEALLAAADPCGWSSDNSEAHGVRILEDGSGVAILGDGHVMVRDPGGTFWRCARQTSPQAPVPIFGLDDTITVERFQRLGVLGRRLFVCGYGTNKAKEQRRFVLSFEGPAPGQPWPESLDLRVEAQRSFAFQNCDAFSPIPGDRLRTSFVDGSGWDFDADGRPIVEYVSLGQPHDDNGGDAYSELEHRLRALRTTTTGWALALSASGSLFRQAPGDRMTIVRGAREYRYWPIQAIAATETREFIAFGGPQPPRVVRVPDDATTCDAIAVRTTSIAGHRLDPTDRVSAVVPDSRGPRHRLLAGFRYGNDGRVAWLRRIDLERNRMVAAVPDLAPLPRGAVFDAGAEVMPGLFVLVGTDGALYALRDDQVERLEPDFDDPTTPEIEMPAPIPSDLGHLRRWFTVGAAGGVAWASGYDAVARILVVGSDRRLRAEAFWRTRLKPNAFADVPRLAPPSFTGIRVRDTDRVLLAAHEDLDLGIDRNLAATLWRVDGTPLGSLSVRPHEGAGIGKYKTTSFPIAVLIRDQMPIVVFQEPLFWPVSGSALKLQQRRVVTAVQMGTTVAAGGEMAHLSVVLSVEKPKP